MRIEVAGFVSLLVMSGCGNPGGLKVSGADAGTASPTGAVVSDKDAQMPPVETGKDATAMPRDSTERRLRFNPTARVTFRGNLNPGEVHHWDVASAVATANYSFSLDIIDTSGTPVWMPVYFARETAPPGKGPAGTWTYHAEIGGTQVAGDDGIAWLEGILVFNEDGKLLEARQTTTDIPLKNGGTQTILLDFGAGIAQSGTGDDAVTSMNGETIMTKIVRSPAP